MTISLLSPDRILKDVARKEKQRRLDANLTQQGLADRSGVPLGTLKLFERTGKISFETLLKIAFALSCEEEFSLLFPAPSKLTIDDVIAKPTRQRGTRR
ncbi:helix-turn-helix domain-containing protein [Phyllobacterium sp. K27]